ncbi:uncharacterized protein LOC123720127 [Pieris brassicae]|uniref:Uncharacterized protein n=1 Tax=Pieris brassicae TaxID=7116 RepID=A0A9P0TW22_PIEBR|nr:uncharacterized protein LOC123720127 [Pieris brassicae]CAH4037213.1 unnamed protein product [Pieris brassicae]
MFTRSQIAGGASNARTMLLILAFVSLAFAAPATYDQRQDGEVNVQADVQNVVLLVAIPQKIPSSLLDLSWLKSAKQGNDDIQERADVHVMEAFVEPNTPYRVEIGTEGEKKVEGDGRNAEVLIAGRKPIEAEEQESYKNEFKLIGAMEQCGPDRMRDPVTLMCVDEPETPSTRAPEVIAVST